VNQPETNIELAKLIAGKLIERRDVKAVQNQHGSYAPHRVDMRDTDSETIGFKLSDIVDHIEGRQTYGHYVVSPPGTCRALVFDLDLREKANPARNEAPILYKGDEIDPREIWAGPTSPCKADLALQLRVTAEGIARRCQKVIGTQVMVTYSGSKGMHVYVCLDPGTPAVEARGLAALVIESFAGLIVPDTGSNFFKHAEKMQAISIELFPKQDEVSEGGFGNLVRLPLGINKKSGKAGFFLDMSTPQTEFKIDDPMAALTQGSLR
jgi:hypothetical protein